MSAIPLFSPLKPIRSRLRMDHASQSRKFLPKTAFCDFLIVDQETRLYSMDRGSKVPLADRTEDGGD